MGKRMSVPVALQYLRSTEPALRSAARDYLLGSGSEGEKGYARVVTALVKALDDPDDEFRSSVVFYLGQLGARYDLLLAHLNSDPSAAVRYWCLRRIWPDNPLAPEAYRAALEDGDERVLVEACIKLGLMRRNIPDALRDEVVPSLQRLLEYWPWRVRFQACDTLYKIGAVEEPVVAVLEELQRQPEAIEYNDRRRFYRRQSRHKREYPPWLFTTEELLQAAREALSGQ